MGEIEILLLSENLPQAEVESHLRQVVDFFAHHKLADTTRAKIENDLNNHSFLSRKDSSLVRDILAIGKSSPDSSYFHRKRLRLNSLFFKILNQNLHSQLFAGSDAFRDSSLQAAFWIASSFKRAMDYAFLQSELNIYSRLTLDEIKDKLLLERYHNDGYRKSVVEPMEALPYIGEALRTSRKLKDYRREISILTNIQYLLHSTYGLTNIALRLGAQIAQKIRQLGFKFALPRHHFNMGNTFLEKGLLQEALDEFKLSREASLEVGYDSYISLILERVAIVHQRLGQFDLAINAQKEIMDLQDPNPQRPTRARIRFLIGVGSVHFEQGDYGRAEGLYESALEIATQLEARRDSITLLGLLGKLNLFLGDLKQASSLFRIAINKLRDGDAPDDQANLWIQLSEAYYLDGKSARAEECLDMATGYIGRSRHPGKSGEGYLKLGKIFLLRGQLPDALTLFQKALGIFVQNEAILSQIEVLNLIGESYFRSGDQKSALAFLSQATELEARFPLLRNKWLTFHNVGKVYQAMGQSEKAELHLKKSISTIKALTEKVSNDLRRYDFAAKIQPVFEEMVLLQKDKGDSETALAYSEEMRAQVFKILLNERKPAAITPTRRAGLSLFSEKPSHLSMAARLQSRLGPATALLEYEVTDSLLVIWIVKKDLFQSVNVKISRGRLEKWISEYRNCLKPAAIANAESLDDSFEQSVRLGQRFYTHLLEPVSTYLTDVELLYIVPDEALHYLPFSSIKLPDDSYLVEKKGIVVLPSAVLLLSEDKVTQKTGTRSARKKLLAVAADEGLSEAVEEVKRVGQLNGNTTLLIGREVTERRVRVEMQDSQFILMANHTRINNEKAHYSAIVLNRSDTSQTSENDGYLTVTEIQRLNLGSADLVFLSACESGSGRVFRGEGMVGLQRAFLIAGANSVIANLWEVDDKSARRLAVGFFDHWLNGGVSKAEALRLAQLESIQYLIGNPMYNKKPHPHFWAPATLSGAYN